MGAMVLLVFLVLAGALAWLWRRVDTLEREVVRLRDRAPMPASPASSTIPAERQAPVETVSPGALIPAPSAEPVADAPTAEEEPEPWRPRFDFEDLFGRLLPIWAGGVTLAVAGFFLVRWSIDAGLLTPPVRVVLAGLFGIALIGGAEVAYRWRERVADPRVAQALAGAGLATLYAAFYLAGTAYGLIGSTFAFIGLALVTAAAIALSYRFGLPSAVLGLVGGFAAPALVGSEQANLPLLTLYLALVTTGLSLTGRRQNRGWLGMAALAGGLGWGGLLTASEITRTPDVAVLGAYLVLLGAVIPAISGGEGRTHWWVRVVASGLAALQLAVLVQQGGFAPLAWGMYVLLGTALAWFGWRDAAMREASATAAAVGIALLLVWPSPAVGMFTGVSVALAAIFAGVPLAQIWGGTGRDLDFAQVGGVALGLALAALWQFGSALPDSPQPGMALALFALGCLPAAALALARLSPLSPTAGVRIAAEAIGALLAYSAVAQIAPQDALAWIAALAAAVLAWRWRQFAAASATFAILAALWAVEPLYDWLLAGSQALAGVPMKVEDLPSVRMTGLPLLPAVVGGGAWTLFAAPAVARRITGAAVIVAAAVAAHVLFRHLFAALAGSDFVVTGVIERAVWEAILLGAAWLAATRNYRGVAIGLAVTAFAHFAWFSLVLHNPLWSAQAVGALPVANAVLPSFAVGLAALLLLRRWLPVGTPAIRWVLDGAIMTVIAVFALTELRQLFAGSLLSSTPVGPTEDLLRSLIGIVLAVGFLLWGARTHERSWRIGSLVVMVIAVLKVFLIDAAGLEGLARIASFMALGFSLIGIGWFYARQLRAPVQ